MNQRIDAVCAYLILKLHFCLYTFQDSYLFTFTYTIMYFWAVWQVTYITAVILMQTRWIYEANVFVVNIAELC